MSANTFEASVSERFRLPAPTLISPAGTQTPMTFSHVRCDTPDHGATKSLPNEDAYVLHAVLNDVPSMQLWMDGREIMVPPVKKGEAFLFHYQSDPIAEVHSPFELVRFSVSKAGLDQIADEAGAPRPLGLRRPEVAVADPIAYHLAASLLPFFKRGQSGHQMVLDHIALAFHAHLLSTYSGPAWEGRPAAGGLAPWQLRRAKEFIEANLGGDPSLEDIAKACEISASHFARSFRASVGRPPHQYLMDRRVERAKTLMNENALSLREISAACGFSDQSHFSRIFAKQTGRTPGLWRRSQRV